jgi:endoglucanase
MKPKKMLCLAVLAICMLAGCSNKETEKNVIIITATPTPTTAVTVTPDVTPGITPSATPVATAVPEKIDPSDIPDWREMLELMGTGWNLGNTLDAIDCKWLSDEMEYETGWQGVKVKTTKKMIDTVAAAGFKTVRIPVSWHDHVTRIDSGECTVTYKISEKWMKRVREVVDYCIDDGLFVILNIHHDDGGSMFVYPDAEHEEASMAYLVSVWEQIAKEFGDYDHHLIFETLNEPRLTGANEWNPRSAEAKEAIKYINRYNQAAVYTIRSAEGAYNLYRYIGCPGYDASPDSLDGFVLPKDPSGIEGRIMVSIHAYTPYNFAIAQTTTFGASVKSDVDRVFKVINDKLISKNIPAYMGEWGVYTVDKNYDARMKYVEYYISSARNLRDGSGNIIKMPTIIWDNGSYGNPGENYGLLDRKNNKWHEEEYIKAIINAE